MASIYDWSLLAANNANADGNIDWAEGQAPSTVNNSARFMMQRLKEFISDLGAVTAVGGSANVLTFTAKSAFSAYVDGIRIAFRASTDNTNTATLNVNAVGAKPIVKFTIDGEVSLAAGEMQAGGIYEVIYSAALNGASGAWLLLNPTQQAILPGLVAPYASDVIPSGWLECNGSAISRTTYANLFAAIGTKWGSGDGSTTFNMPDLRGEFLRGWDHGRGADPGRTFASLQGDELRVHTHGVNDPGHAHTYERPRKLVDGDRGTLGSQWSIDEIEGLGTFPNTTGITVQNFGGAETRPRNIALTFMIKT